MGTPAIVVMADLKIIARHLRLVAEIRDRGMLPVLVSRRGPDSGRLLERCADPAHPLAGVAEVALVSGPGTETILSESQALLRRHDVAGVLSCGEVYVEPAAVLAELLGLPGSGWAAAHVGRSKLLQRYRLPTLAPRWQVVAPAARSGFVPALDFPVVVKPIARMSSSGVRQAGRPEDLDLAAYPPDEVLLVEELVHGPEFSVESIVQAGQIRWAGVTRKVTNESSGRFFAEISHVVPADRLTEPERTTLLAANRTVVEGLGFRDGVGHVELRLSERGPVLMEAAVRLAGDCITTLWELATGAPIEPVLIDLALGEQVSYPATLRRRALHRYLEPLPGRLRDVTSRHAPVRWVARDDHWPTLPVAGPDAAPRCCAVLVSKAPGLPVGLLEDNNARAVSIIVDAPLSEPIDVAARDFIGDVAIHVDPA